MSQQSLPTGTKEEYKVALATAIYLIDGTDSTPFEELPKDVRTVYLHEADRWAEDPERRMR